MKKKLNATNTKRLTLRISPELFEAVKAKAQKCGLSVSSYVRLLIVKAQDKEKN